MRYTRSAAFTVFLAVAVFAIAIAIFGTVHAQPPLLGQLFGHLFPRYDTAPISGDVFRCYVTNVGTLPAYVVDIFIYDGSTGETIGAGDTISSNGSVYTVPDCDTSFEPFLLEPPSDLRHRGSRPQQGLRPQCSCGRTLPVPCWGGDPGRDTVDICTTGGRLWWTYRLHGANTAR